jgi:hypothetical protein
MAPSKIELSQALFNVNRTGQVAGSPAQQSHAEHRISAPQNDSAAWVKESRSSAAFGRLQAIKSGINLIATNIRAADSAMEAIGTHIDRMKASLEGIVKSYPPFPPGSEERVELLKSFSTIRRLIDQLTVPPTDDGASRIMADPAQVPEAGMWEVVVDELGATVTIHSQEVHTGPTGLDIPPLAEDASDAEIWDALGRLDAAGAKLRDRRTGLARNAETIIGSGESGTEPVGFQRSYAGGFSPGGSDLAVESMSMELKRTIAEEPIRALTELQPQLLELIR